MRSEEFRNADALIVRMQNSKCKIQNLGTLRVDCTSGKLQVASGKFRNCVAIIDNLKCCEALHPCPLWRIGRGTGLCQVAFIINFQASNIFGFLI